jgi:anti-sigma factor RsiW
VSSEHRELREELGAYALGQLAGDRWRAVDEHLGACASCRAELEEIAPVAGLLGAVRDRVRAEDLDGAPAVVPPLSDALLAEVRATTSAPRPAVRLGSRWLAAAAAAVALLAGGAGYLAGSAGGEPAAPLETVAVRALDPAVSARAALVPHTWGMEVKLTATGFAPGQVFTVTVTDDAGRTVGAGEFLGTGAEEMRCNLNSSVLRADAELVQVRDAAGAVVLDVAV